MFLERKEKRICTPKGLLSPFRLPVGQMLLDTSVFWGVLRCSGALEWHACLRGTLIHGVDAALDDMSVLWVGPRARIEGTVLARRVVIHGCVEGEIYVSQVLHISSLGCVRGHVECAHLRLDFGGILQGTSRTHVQDIELLMQRKIRTLSRDNSNSVVEGDVRAGKSSPF